MSLITVAIAAYNVEKYIATMLDSIIAQTYVNLDILVINDGSTDGTLEICRQYTDSRIRVITKENGGLSTARQTALENARGDYLCMVDGDDVLHSRYVEDMYRLIRETNADICVCEYQEFLSDPQEGGRRITLSGPNAKIIPQQLANGFYNMVNQYKLADSWNKMYRTQFLKDAGVAFFLDKKYNGTDLFFNHALALHCPSYAVLNEVRLYYRLTPNSRVRRKDKDLQTGFEMIVERLLEESRSLKHTDAVTEQIYLVYLDMIRRALADRFRNADNYKDFGNQYKIFRQKNRSFTTAHFNGASTRRCTKGMKLFILLLSFPGAYPMYAYMQKRQGYIQKTVSW